MGFVCFNGSSQAMDHMVSQNRKDKKTVFSMVATAAVGDTLMPDLSRKC